VSGLLQEQWDALTKALQAPDARADDVIADHLSGLGITRGDVAAVLEADTAELQQWEPEDIDQFVQRLRREAMPLLHACNKVDVPGADANLETLTDTFPEERFIPVSAQAEQTLQTAADQDVIDYVPGDSQFEIVGDVSGEQEDGLRRIQALLDEYPPLIEHAESRGSDLLDVGQGENAGGEFHTELLQAAQQHFEDKGAQVNLLYQDAGDDRPDGHIHRNGELAHLEAEHATLSKPAKVLTNLKRAAEQDRQCLYIVEAGNAAKLTNIVDDPVDRRGAQHEDDDGTYSYYEADGEAFTDIDTVEDAEYAVFEVTDDGAVHEYATGQEMECPELDDNTQENLEEYCIYRDPDDGHCSELGAPCVFADD
jgi:hypothetical protein